MKLKNDVAIHQWHSTFYRCSMLQLYNHIRLRLNTQGPINVTKAIANDLVNMDVEVNYLGAAIFWLYIAAALLMSGVVICTIVTLPLYENNGTPHRWTDTLIFGSLACISFATLSYNMLSVLIQSFSSWSQRPISLELLQRTGIWSDIWTWSTESTLFQDFGGAIVASGARQYWTQAALIATMSVCLFMGGEGETVRDRLRRTWAF